MSLIQWFLVWLPGTFLLVYVASIDLFPVEQFLLSLFCIVAMGLFYVIERRKEKKVLLSWTRLSFMVIGGFVAIRYLIWRVQFSVPWGEDPFSLFCSLALLFAEIMGITLSLLGAFINIHPLRREAIAVDMEDDRLPTVDVMVPSYNESSALLRTTLLAATQMEYPEEKLKVYLLDDGGTDAKCQQQGQPGEDARARREQLQQLCQDVGCVYLARQNNHSAKAGNVNEGMKHSSGELIVIFDADHIPAVDFLEKTVGSIMEDERVAIVQTPHFMLNRDPIEKNLGVSDDMPGEGEMFYTLNLRGMDNWNSGFFCGSGALIRRSALNEVGGILTDTIVEDADTSMELLRKGYKTRYLHRPLLAGLSAESLPSFIVQRTRWATGMIQLLRFKNPLMVDELTPGQRLGYFNTQFYWLFGLAHVIFILSPAMALIFGAVLFSAPPTEIFLYVTPYLLAIYLSMHMLYGRVRWLFVSEIYETIQSFLMMLAPLKTFFSPSGKLFYVTPKEESLEEDSISSMSVNFYILFSVLAVAMGLGVFHIVTEEQGVRYYLVSLLWNIFNMLFVLAALGAMVEKKQRRHRPRVKINEIARLIIRDNKVPCNVEDMTEDGALIRLPKWAKGLDEKQGTLSLKDSKSADGCLTNVLSVLSSVPFEVVRTQTTGEGDDAELLIGIRFNYETIEQRRSVIAYVYGNSERWRQTLKNRNKPSTISGGWYFLLRSAGKGLLHLSFLMTRILRGKSVFLPANGLDR